MINIKTKSRIIAIGWISYVVLLMLYYTKMVSFVQTSGFFIGFLVYLLSNPAYLVLIYYIVKTSKNSKIKASLASILIILSLDLVTSPRVLVNELFTTGTATIMNSGTIAIKAMMGLGLPATLAWYLYYLILPIIFFLLAMEILGVVDFIKKFGNGGA